MVQFPPGEFLDNVLKLEITAFFLIFPKPPLTIIKLSDAKYRAHLDKG
jgi:hypothetical protein